MQYLSGVYPIWESRYSEHNPPPANQTHRMLLRPVYWLGNWQFACLNYYHPPKGIENRCVTAEPFPAVLQSLVIKAQEIVHNEFLPKDVPKNWHLNTCLINYYGDKLEAGKRTDVARVGEHKDFEPGPVASISFGQRALFQFVRSNSRQSQSQVAQQLWLEDSSLLIFGGDRYKKHLFHRVQRVEKKGATLQNLNTTDFETRRLNFTFRYVPTEHIKAFHQFPSTLQKDVRPYIEMLAQHSDFFSRALGPASK